MTQWEQEGGQQGEAREDSDAITTSDGDVRQLEKADLNAARGTGNSAPPVRPVPARDPDFGEVISLGKGDGAPEEDAANISDFSPAENADAGPRR
jgi:hypothetical protein